MKLNFRLDELLSLIAIFFSTVGEIRFQSDETGLKILFIYLVLLFFYDDEPPILGRILERYLNAKSHIQTKEVTRIQIVDTQESSVQDLQTQI